MMTLRVRVGDGGGRSYREARDDVKINSQLAD